jgi:hypothetical protein
MHLQVAKMVMAAHISVLDEQRRKPHGVIPPEAYVIVLDIRSTDDAQMHIGLASMVNYFQDRIQGDCPQIEDRAHDMVTRYVAKCDPKARLVEMQIAWNTERRIAMLIEFRKEGADWEIGRSLVRVE